MRVENSRDSAAPRALAAVTFDVTQTLIHAPDLGRVYLEVLSRHHPPTRTLRTRDMVREIVWVWKELSCAADPRRDRFATHPKGARGWWHDFLRRLCRRLDLAEPSPFAAAELFDRFAQAEAWQVYPDVWETLQTLRDHGVRLGVVSNWDERLPKLLDRLDLVRHFDVVVVSSAVGLEKPNPRIFKHCLEQLGVEPEEALHIGDGPIDDVEGAMAAGMRALRIDRAEPVQLQELVLPLLKVSAGSPRHGSAPILRPVGGRHV